MSLPKASLPERDTLETFPYSLNLARWTNFANGTEVVSTVTWKIYLSTDTSFATNLSSLLSGAGSFVGNLLQSPSIVTPAKGSSYVLEATITCNSGYVYIARGTFKVV